MLILLHSALIILEKFSKFLPIDKNIKAESVLSDAILRYLGCR